MPPDLSTLRLDPLPYMAAIAEHLETTEPEAWRWFSEDLTAPVHAERVRLELLKATYRIERDDRPALYAAADRVRERLGITANVTLYHLQRTPGDGVNAALFYLPGEVHVAFVGPVLEVLDDDELVALLGHELAHFMLLEGWENRYRVAEELLGALASDRDPHPVHGETLRLFHLYREVFCDRAALIASTSLDAAVTLLVKVETGVREINSESYLRQTEEIFAGDAVHTAGLSHPECFVRARALALWREDPEHCEDAIRAIIEGPPTIEGLDLLGQERLADATRCLVDAVLAENWMRSESVLAHARLFFPDFKPRAEVPADDELTLFKDLPPGRLADYACYVILDFVACDRDLEEPALANGLLLSRRLGLVDTFRRITLKELKLKKRQFTILEEQAGDLLAAAARQDGAS